MAFKFVHAADLHLDSPMRGLDAHRLPASFASPTFRAFERIVSLCLREKADFLLLAGDLFDSKDRSVRARLHLHRELSRLDAAGIATFIVHGNHDPLSADPGGLSLPGSVKCFGASWEEVKVLRGEKVLCRVQGISFATERVTENLAAHFSRKGPEFTVGLLHANLGGLAGHANYAPCSLSDLERSGLDYWALGHVHTRSIDRLPSGTLVVYPGNSQGRHINEAEARGCMLVEVDDSGVAQARFVGLEPVRWLRVAAPVGGHETFDALLSACEEQVREASQGAEAAVVRVRLEGRGVLHRQLGLPGGLAAFEESLRASLAAGEVPIHLEKVEDSSAPELDLERLVEGGGLLGAVAESSVGKAAPSLVEALYEEDDLRKLDSVLHRAGLPRTQERAQEWIAPAALRALDLLWEEDEA